MHQGQFESRSELFEEEYGESFEDIFESPQVKALKDRCSFILSRADDKSEPKLFPWIRCYHFLYSSELHVIIYLYCDHVFLSIVFIWLIITCTHRCALSV